MFSEVADSQPSVAWRNSSKGVQPLFVGGDQQDRNLHGIAEVNLAQISHMAFGGEGRPVAFLHVAGPDPELEP